jgi:hypothetical protein
VAIDGQAIGRTPIAAYPLKPGTHVAQCENRERGVRRIFKFLVDGGKTVEIVRNLYR